MSRYLFYAYYGGDEVRFVRSAKGISRLALMLILIISFLLGATLSYIFTLGFYAPYEYRLPKKTTLAMQDIEFSPRNATFFNVTILNPSYSPSNVTIEAIQVETIDNRIHNTLTQSLPYSLGVSASKTFQSFWNWGNYTGQAVQILAFVSDGSGSNLKAVTPYMNFSITNVDLKPAYTVKNFTVTVQNPGSSTFLNVTGIFVNGALTPTVPSLVRPYGLTNASNAAPVTFVVEHEWLDMQNRSSSIAIQTLQGYTAYKTITGPLPMRLNITNAVFNATIGTGRFNITVYNSLFSPADLDLQEVTVYVAVNMTEPVVIDWTAYYQGAQTTKLLRSVSPTLVACVWDWSGYRNQTVIITVGTVQGFGVTNQFQIPPP